MVRCLTRLNNNKWEACVECGSTSASASSAGSTAGNEVSKEELKGRREMTRLQAVLGAGVGVSANFFVIKLRVSALYL